MPEKKSAGESFAGNVMKYSVATYLGFAITGLALIVKGLLPAEVLGAPVTFMTYTATVKNLGILGLDQTLLRFYHEPPAGAEPRQLFAACTRMSVVFMLVLGAVCSLFAARPMAVAFGFGADGQGLVPLLFWAVGLVDVHYLSVICGGVSFLLMAAAAGKRPESLHRRDAVDAGVLQPHLPAARLLHLQRLPAGHGGHHQLRRGGHCVWV